MGLTQQLPEGVDAALLFPVEAAARARPSSYLLEVEGGDEHRDATRRLRKAPIGVPLSKAV
jgi:hypothetical protein